MMATRTTTLIPVSVLLGASLLFAACASTPEVRTKASPTANLSSYQTYGFVATPGTDRGGLATPLTAYFKEAATREMNARGYTYQAAGAQLLLNFHFSGKEQVEVQSTPSAGYYGGGYYGYRGGMYSTPGYMGSDVSTVRYKVGTVNVDVVDAAKRELIWEGIVEGRLSDKALQDPQGSVNKVITELFTRFPKQPLVAPAK